MRYTGSGRSELLFTGRVLPSHYQTVIRIICQEKRKRAQQKSIQVSCEDRIYALESE